MTLSDNKRLQKTARVSNHRIMALLPSVLVLAILLVTQASVLGDTEAQHATNPGAGGAIVIAIICYTARKKQIGGWLLYYYISLYAGVAISLLLLPTTLQNYSQGSWQSTELRGLAIASTALDQLTLLIQAAVATILLMWREWKWVRLLRAILIGGVIWSAISVVLDFAFFSQGFAVLGCFTFIWLAIWLAYFFRSERVKRVFLSKDWDLAAPTPPPRQVSVTPSNAALPSLAASEPRSPEKHKTNKGALFFLLGAIAFCGIVILFFRPWEKNQAFRPAQAEPEVRRAIPVETKGAPRTESTTQPSLAIPSTPSEILTPGEIFHRARPSVVLLTMQDAHGQPISLGSGFFVEKDVVATNFHVIDQAASGYAKIVGQSVKLQIQGIVALDTPHDLALLQLEASAPPLPVAPKLSVNIGDPVYAIGNPLGLEGTFSPGVVSSVRKVDSVRLVQITAPISPGSSGGPVLDQTGSVVGVSFASIENGQNLNFAIPAEYVAALQKNKTALHPFKAFPRAKARTTLLDQLGGQQPRAGVVGENFMWGGPATMLGVGEATEFSFSLHNKLAQNVSKVQGFTLFYSSDGEPLDTMPFQYEDTILAQSAKRINSVVVSSVQSLMHAVDVYYWWDRRARTWRKTDDWRYIPEVLSGAQTLDELQKKGWVRTEHREGKVEFRILDFTVE